MLLITDGNNNHGTALRDAILQATTLNSTIHALKLDPILQDTAIIIDGPDKISPGVEALFTLQLKGTEPNKKQQVIITIDDKEILNEQTTGKTFTHTFTEGTHKIKATLQTKDAFEENNEYYKTIRVIQKPTILFYTQEQSPLTALLEQLYEVEITNTLTPLDKTKHYALVLNNIPAAYLEKELPKINDYLSGGNGLLVIGGRKSFDKGAYQKSKFENILPTQSAVAGEKDEGIVNLVIVIDISRSAAKQYGQGSIADVEKAIAVSTIENLKDTHQVGLIAFNTEAYIVQDLLSLKENRDTIINKITTLEKKGDSYMPPGIEAAIQMVDRAGGAKNILFISDGKAGGMGEAKLLAQAAKDKNIKIYGVGVGDSCIKYNQKNGDCQQWSTEMYGINAIKAIAKLAGGIYFHGEETAQRVKVIFGNAEGGEDKDNFRIETRDATHFITQNLDIDAKVTGFNNIIPKKTAHLLATTDTGEPLLIVWRYGIGRVATLSTDDGSAWAGQLLQTNNAFFYTKTINWLIGDPEKKSKQFTHIPDTNIGRIAEIITKAEKEPETKELKFYKKEGGLYVASFTPQKTGFQTLLNTDYAVNYNKELEALGISEELQTLLSTTGGTSYNKENIQNIIKQASTQNERPEEQQQSYSWLLILIILILFLLEITIRRIREHKSI